MSQKPTRRPLYMRQPWDILFKPNTLEKLTPWNVNITYLLRSFLTEMDREGKTDFRASGVALNSSALIYLMKSKLLLAIQEPPTMSKPIGDFVPPPLFLPLRHELTSTTIQHLLETLKDVIEGEKLLNLDRGVPPTRIFPPPSEVMPQFDKFIADLKLQMGKLYVELTEKTKGAGIVDFSRLTKGKSRTEMIRTFSYLLFLAQEGKVGLLQNEETEELYIIVGRT